MKKLKRISSKEIEILRSDGSEDVIVEGYAAVYNSRSVLLSERGKQFYETIQSGAFSDAISRVNEQQFDCVATFQHERSSLLARTNSGTLKIWDDADGLKFRFAIPNTSIGNDVREMLQRGDLTQCSFSAIVPMDGYDEQRGEDGTIERKISRFEEIRDVALVIDPAYPATYASEVERSIEEFENKENEITRAREEAENEDKARLQAELDLLDLTLNTI